MNEKTKAQEDAEFERLMQPVIDALHSTGTIPQYGMAAFLVEPGRVRRSLPDVLRSTDA